MARIPGYLIRGQRIRNRHGNCPEHEGDLDNCPTLVVIHKSGLRLNVRKLSSWAVTGL